MLAISIKHLKERVFKAIDEISEEIIKIGEEIRRTPELGFKELRTSNIVKREIEKLGLDYENGLALTGVKAKLKETTEKPVVAVLGELDAVPCPEHPLANRETGAAHACGHNVQVAIMLAVGRSLLESGVINELSGNVVLIAVPAEEYVEIEHRLKLREEGKIEFLGGKQELIRLGVFDDIDLAMMVHAWPRMPRKKVWINFTSNGFISKYARFIGKAAHAAAAPHEGVNALNAAALAILAIHAQRETFRDEDYVRVHGIITKGGDAVNVVPSDVRMEMYVRGKTYESIEDASLKVDRALKSGALAVGGSVEIRNIPGYLPLIQNENLSEVFKSNAIMLLGKEGIVEGGHQAWSTDMGDVSHIIPSIHPLIGGFDGDAHAKNFDIKDPEMAYIISTKIVASTIIDLLANNASTAKQIVASFKPKMTKEKYLKYLRKMFK